MQDKLNHAVAMALGQMHLQLIAAQVAAQDHAERADNLQAQLAAMQPYKGTPEDQPASPKD